MRHIKSIMNSNFEIKLYFFVILTIFFLSILRGIRFPNIWSYSHFLFNYDFGFTKRGLLGEIISQFNNPYLISYEFFFIFSIAIFAINVILLSILIRDFVNSRNPVLIGCSLVFVSSLVVVFLSNSIGYFDHIGLLIALVTLKISRFYKKILFLLPSMTFALITHEAILTIFFPVIFMSLLFDIKPEGSIKKVVTLGLFSALSVTLVLFVSSFTLEPSETRKMYSNLQAQIDHPLRKDAFDVLHRDAKTNYEIMQNNWSDIAVKSGWAKRVTRFIKLIESFLVTMPVLSVFIYFSVLFLRTSKVKFGLVILSILASVSPLLLHFFAWDMHRWNILAVATSFLMLYVVHSSKTNNQSMVISRNIYPVFIFVFFLNGISQIGLFDGYYVKQFPFFEHQQYIFDLISGNEVFPYVPSR